MSKTRMIYQTEETRDAIISKARELFIEKGFFETQMSDLARETGLSRTSIYRYFKDKADLALIILELIYNELYTEDYARDLEASGLSPVEKVRKYFRDVWLNPDKMSNYQFIAEFDAYYTGSRLPEGFRESLRAIFMENNPEMADLLLRIIRKGIESGDFSSDLDPYLTVITLVNSVRGMHQRVLLREDVLVETDAAQAAQMVELQLDWLLKAISA